MQKNYLSWLLCLALSAGVETSLAQNPLITSFSRNGVLTCSNLVPGTVAAVEWAPTPTGPWQADWSGLMTVPVASNHTIQASVPMFYRVRGYAETNFTADGMALVPAGTFTIGDTIDGDIPTAQPTNVYVSSFLMDSNLVSGALWQSVLTYAGSHGFTLNGGSGEGFAKATNHPMSQCRWDDVLIWCNARSKQAGLMPVYYADAGLTQVYTNGPAQTGGFYPNWTATGYRLPTEAEWEKAARGGLTGMRFPWGNLISWANANYTGNLQDASGVNADYYFSYGLSPLGVNPVYSNTVPYTSPVGSFPPNGYGLFDMAGNDYQWCWDWYAMPPYPAGSAYLGGSDPRGPVSGANRVARSASWNFTANDVRCAARLFGSPNLIYAQLSFRCVRRP